MVEEKMWGDPTQVGQLYEPRSGASKAGVFNQGAVGLYVSTLPSDSEVIFEALLGP